MMTVVSLDSAEHEVSIGAVFIQIGHVVDTTIMITRKRSVITANGAF